MLKYRIYYSIQRESVLLRMFDSIYRPRSIIHISKRRLNKDKVIIKASAKSPQINKPCITEYTFIYHQYEIILKSYVPLLTELEDEHIRKSDFLQIDSDVTIFAILCRYLRLLKHFYDSKAFSILYHCLIIVHLFCCSDAWNRRRSLTA